MNEKETRAREIADAVVPKYRASGRSYDCGSWVAKMWGAAYDGALRALDMVKETKE